MPDEKLPLIVHPGSGLARVGPQGGRIVAEMVSGALALSRTGEALVPQFKVGDHVFCAPDYQQILLWAESLTLEAEEIIERLLVEPETDLESECEKRERTQVLNGRIIKVAWDMRLLPLTAFEWVDGLVIQSLNFFGTDNAHEDEPVECSLPLPQPELRVLRCANMGLTRLDLSRVPQLETLSCERNDLTELDLSAVPQLTELRCGFNGLTKLDLSSVPKLTELYCQGYADTILDTPFPLSGLAELDLSFVPLLTRLNCDANKLTKLDLSGVTRLTNLVCDSNRLNSLDVTVVPELVELWCQNNQLAELDLTAVPLLKKLFCAGNLLTKLDLSVVPLLTHLWCRGNRLAELDIRPLNALEWHPLFGRAINDANTLLIQRPDQNF